MEVGVTKGSLGSLYFPLLILEAPLCLEAASEASVLEKLQFLDSFAHVRSQKVCFS